MHFNTIYLKKTPVIIFIIALFQYLCGVGDLSN